MNRDAFDGRVALVTGGGRGIGEATAVLLAERGAAVCVLDQDAESVRRVVDAIAAAGGRAHGVVGDVSRQSDVDGAVRAAVEVWGRLELLVANAALGGYGNVLETTLAHWDRMLAVNLTGVYLSARACLPHMIAAGRGAIVAISSDCAIRTCACSAAYNASKAGGIALIRSIAVDFGAQGVRANLVVPGVTDTPGLRTIYGDATGDAEQGLAKARALSPLGRVARPLDLARAACFLLSDEAEHITGAALSVDGGTTITYGAD